MLNSFENTKTGYYLIRESRNDVNAYTLSLCSGSQIYNYRIIRLSDTGEYCFGGPSGEEGSHTRFDTMKELIEHYEQTPVRVVFTRPS